MSKLGVGKWIWRTWRAKRREEKTMKKWNKGKTIAKTKSAAVPVGAGAALVAILRAALGDRLPWTPDQDAWVAGIIMTLGSAVWTYCRDKQKHGGFEPAEESAT